MLIDGIGARQSRLLAQLSQIVQEGGEAGGYAVVTARSDAAARYGRTVKIHMITKPEVACTTAPATKVTRRDFLKASGVLMGVLSTSSAFLAFAPSRAWAVELSALTDAQGQTLMAFARTLYPHDTLDDAAYALVVKALDGSAKDKATLDLLSEGIQTLDSGSGGSFVNASEDARLAAAKAIEGTPFFKAVRGTTVGTLYNNPIAFAHFDYQGSAWEQGGYKHRGFDDLTWLPNPPAAASPAKD